MVTAEESLAAARRGREMWKNVPHATQAMYDKRLHRVLIRLSNRLEIALNPDDHQSIQKALPEQLREIELMGKGYVIYFPKIDEGIYVPALIQGILGSKKWMEETAAKDRKAFAARANTIARKRKVEQAA